MSAVGRWRAEATRARKPWRSGWCTPGNPLASHARCLDHPRRDGVPCSCDCHVERTVDLPPEWPPQFVAKVQPRSTGCWEWTASCDTTGYGHIRHEGKLRQAHIVGWELVNGPVPDGMQLDHTCHVPAECTQAPCEHRRCVNPTHLTPVTQGDNVRRGNAQRDWSGLCRNGEHPWVPENIITNERTGNRQCRACKKRTDAARGTRVTRLTPTGVLVTDAEPETPAWFEARRGGITGTDLPKILGLTRYGNALSCWLDKRGELDDEAGEAALWGQILEDAVAQEWARRNGTTVTDVGVLRHVAEPWRRISLDRLVDECPDGDGPCALEIKTRSAFVADRWRDGIPDDVLAQTTWGLSVTGLSHHHVACLLGGQRLKSYRVERDPKLEEYLLDAARPVWQAVTEGVPPEAHPDSEGVLLDLLDRLYSKRAGEREIDAEKARPWLDQYAEGAELAKRGDALKVQAKTALVQLLDDGDTGVIDDEPVFTYRAPTPKDTLTADNLRALREASPEIYDALRADGFITVTNPRPTFNLKGSKA